MTEATAFCTMIAEFDLQSRLQGMSCAERRTIATELVACTAMDPRKRSFANRLELLKNMTSDESLLDQLQKCCAVAIKIGSLCMASAFREHLFHLEIVKVGIVSDTGRIIVACPYNSKRDIEQLLQTFNDCFTPNLDAGRVLVMDDERWTADADWVYADYDLDNGVEWTQDQMRKWDAGEDIVVESLDFHDFPGAGAFSIVSAGAGAGAGAGASAGPSAGPRSTSDAESA